MTIDFIRNTELSEDQIRRRYSLTQQMNQLQSARNQHADDEVNAVIRNYELAWRMQAQAPEIVANIGGGEEVLQLFVLHNTDTVSFPISSSRFLRYIKHTETSAEPTNKIIHIIKSRSRSRRISRTSRKYKSECKYK